MIDGLGMVLSACVVVIGMILAGLSVFGACAMVFIAVPYMILYLIDPALARGFLAFLK